MTGSGALRVAILALSAKSYGGDSYFRALLPALGKYGGDIEFFILAYDDRYQCLIPESGQVHLYRCGAFARKLGPFRVIWEQLSLPLLLSKLKIDVVYTANNQGLFFSVKPCVIAIRNMEPLVSISPRAPARFRIRHKILRFLTHMSIKRSKRIVAVSKFVRETLETNGVSSEKIDVVYHGIDDIDLVSREISPIFGKKDIPYVASAAKFIRYANLETLFRAFAKLKKRGYRGFLYFAGGSYDERYEKEIRTLIRVLEIEQDVRFLGYISRIEVQQMIRGCDVFLFPSTLEACPFTLLEAMRHGKPIVATTASPMPEFCQNAAIYVEPADSNAFAEAAFSIISKSDLRESLSENALHRASDFRWRDSVKQLKESFKIAVNG